MGTPPKAYRPPKNKNKQINKNNKQKNKNQRVRDGGLAAARIQGAEGLGARGQLYSGGLEGSAPQVDSPETFRPPFGFSLLDSFGRVSRRLSPPSAPCVGAGPRRPSPHTPPGACAPPRRLPGLWCAPRRAAPVLSHHMPLPPPQGGCVCVCGGGAPAGRHTPCVHSTPRAAICTTSLPDGSPNGRGWCRRQPRRR